ncbi:hypothetical protein [Francisella uliginis]|uniref:Uncharacterized protein n=1 Tax=Francisella uliginis TaxID=573570 RepID=A0A1L4BQ12_9GAMM|nr:hypothetical protein [Francisella uliginis]API85922.1 hypothetical protein F7310_00490 [Francisella uliginis]
MIKSVVWQEVSEKVRDISPELYNIICEISPDSNYPLFLMQSNYGEDISRFFSENLDENLLLALQLSRVTERFDDYDGEPSNFHTYVPGDLLFLDKTITFLEGFPFYCSSKYVSGVRSAFMVPKISDSRSHKRLLSHYKIDVPSPKKSIYEHWEVFKGIANSKLQPYKWTSELLFFSDSWFKHIDDEKWCKFYKYIYKQSFIEKYRFNIEKFWDSYLNKIRSIKCGPYSIETVRRILNILSLSKHGYVFAHDNEDYLPIKQIQNAYNEVYQIGENAPIIMYAKKYDVSMRENNIPIYYSLSVPDIRNIRYISRGIQSANQELAMLVKLNKELTNLASTCPNVAIGEDIKFKYFHSEDNVSSPLESIQSIQKIDKVLKEILENQYPGKNLSSYSNFLRGSVAII